MFIFLKHFPLFFPYFPRFFRNFSLVKLGAPGAQLGRGGLPGPGGRCGQGPPRERGGADGAAGEAICRRRMVPRGSQEFPGFGGETGSKSAVDLEISGRSMSS